MTGRVVALPERGEPRMNRVVLQSGRWLDPHDARGVLVSEAFAQARGLEPQSRVTLLINGKYETLEIRGIVLSPEFIYAAAPGGFSDDTRFGVFWLPRDRLDAAYDMKGAFNYVTLRVMPGASIDSLIASTDLLLEPYGSTGAYDREDQLSHRTLSDEIEQQRVFAIVFPLVFMGVALFLLDVLLGRHIATERSQIATLKALGYSNTAVATHFLQLVLLIAVLGVVGGIALGVWFGSWMTDLYTRFFHFPVGDYRLELWLPITAAVVTLIAAVGATIRAIYAVAKLAPAEAMRPPSPASFKATLMDRLGFGRLYSPEMRMIVREIERRPLRAGMTALGIASSTGILIAGTWWWDAFNYLMHIEFEFRERADVILALAEPTETGALHELARLPGVLAVEGARDVPVDLKHRHYRLRSVVIGLDEDAKLRHTVDVDMRALPVVPGGIALSKAAAKQLHARPGDQVWVDPLEGARPARLMPVTQIMGDLTSTAAYMPRREATALAGREDTITSARLQIDARQRDAFFERARQIPRVASIGDKKQLLAHFRESSARNLLAFTTILSVFAGAIAVGVVYNSARIQLAEHSWELATLRVLGFTRAEVSRMLLGQLTVQMIAAMPVGCLMGFGLAWVLAAMIESNDMEIPLLVLPATYAYSILIMLAAGVVSALIVRRRIDQLDLVGVLKTRE
jgi:putative ABC transport system permease protein